MYVAEHHSPDQGFLRSVLDASTDCIKVIGSDGSLQFMNANGMCAMEIDDLSCVQGLDWASLWPQQTASTVRDAVAAAREGRTVRFDAFCPTAKGTPRWWEVSVGPIRDASGAITGVVSVSRDVTERRRAEDALRESEARFRNLADQSPVMMWVAEPNGACSYVSRSWREFTGRTLDTPDDWLDCVHPADMTLVRDKIDALRDRREGAHLEYRLRRADGSYRWVLDVAVPRVSEGGTFLGFVGSVVDITEQREREDETQRYRALVEQSSDFIGFTTLDRSAVFANEGARRLVGAPDGVDLTRLEILDFFLPEDRAYVAEHIIPPQLAGEAWEGEFRFRHFVTGEPIPVWYNSFPIKDEAGRVTALATVTRDIRAQKGVEAALRSSGEHLRLAQTAGRIATWEWNLFSGKVAWSQTMYDLLGMSPDAGSSFEAFASHVHPEDLPGMQDAVGAALAGAPYDVEFRILRSDGEHRWLAGRAEVVRDADGRPERMLGVNYDVTERREATDALAALNATLEARIRESASKLAQLEKIESIGRLTGGIAHDFNNLLTVVMANLEAVQLLVGRDARIGGLVRSAIRGAERGAALTQRLLAFARKQDLHPAAVHVPELVAGMSDLLSRSLGSRFRVETSFAPDLPPALVDANQLELAILNLAVNARDAMPEGGAVMIEVDAATMASPGHRNGIDCIRLRVTDRGIGMDEATLRRAMEPFYTTKEVGKGTGLGLSMVHGLAAQSGGNFVLRSQLGQGTTAEILLPAAEEPQEGGCAGAATGDVQEPASTPLLVMVVDDDADVLAGSAAVVEALGHRTLRASSGGEALQVLRQAPDIDVVLTDLSMPDMSGVELAEQIQVTAPHLPIILATGFADIGNASGSLLPRMLKPFREGQLAMVLSDIERQSRT